MKLIEKIIIGILITPFATYISLKTLIKSLFIKGHIEKVNKKIDIIRNAFAELKDK